MCVFECLCACGRERERERERERGSPNIVADEDVMDDEAELPKALMKDRFNEVFPPKVKPPMFTISLKLK